MSSTNRGAVRNPKDFYPTPESAFLPLLSYLPSNRTYWEPAAGDGRLVRWMIRAGLRADGDDIEGSGRDFLSDPTLRDIIVTNPPFSLAMAFCRHAVQHGSAVFLLLPLNFLGSQERKGWFQAHEPSALFILTKRPSFTPDGKTDSCNYAWFHWGAIHTGITHL